MTDPCPSRASSTALDRISKKECSHPSSPSEPNMTPGRLRTRSAPLSDVMLSSPYPSGLADADLAVFLSFWEPL